MVTPLYNFFKMQFSFELSLSGKQFVELFVIIYMSYLKKKMQVAKPIQISTIQTFLKEIDVIEQATSDCWRRH